MSTAGAARNRVSDRKAFSCWRRKVCHKMTTEEENQEGHLVKAGLMPFNISWKRAEP